LIVQDFTTVDNASAASETAAGKRLELALFPHSGVMRREREDEEAFGRWNRHRHDE
jgi:hypothetical protein